MLLVYHWTFRNSVERVSRSVQMTWKVIPLWGDLVVRVGRGPVQVLERGRVLLLEINSTIKVNNSWRKRL